MNNGRPKPLLIAAIIFTTVAAAITATAQDSPCNLIYYNVNLDASTYCAQSSGHNAWIEGSWSNASYQWEIIGGTIESGQGTRAIRFNVGSPSGAPGMVRITVNAPPCGSPMIDGTMFSIAAPAEVVVDAPAEVCALSRGHFASVVNPVNTGYQWTIRNGSILQMNSDATTVEFSSGGSGEVELAARPVNGCWAAVPTLVAIRPFSSGPIDAENACAGSERNVASVPDAGQGAAYQWTIHNGTITSPAPHGAVIEFTAGDDGFPITLSADVTQADGCAFSWSRMIEVLPAPSTAIVAPASTCSGASTSASVADAGSGADYIWTVENGTITSPAPHGAAIEFVSDSADAPSVLGVTVRNAAACSQTGAATIAVHRTPSAAIDGSPVCAASHFNRASVPDAGSGTTYVWKADNAEITSNSGGTIEFTAGVGPDPVTLSVTATSAERCSALGSTSLPVDNCDEFCSLDQAFYGTGTAQFNGTRADWLIGTLLPITLGQGSNTFTVPAGAEQCILASLPATGAPSALQPGNQVFGPTSCTTLEPVEGNGKLRNVLLGEMLALALNVKLQREKLLSVPLCAAFETQSAIAGVDGLLGDNDDRRDAGADGVPGPNCSLDPLTCPNDDPVQVRQITAAVLDSLDQLRMPRTGFGLYHLGNRALAGEPTGTASPEEIASSIAALNEAFSSCRFLRGCVDPAPPAQSRRRPASRGEN